jgi:hypothetical protein
MSKRYYKTHKVPAHIALFMGHFKLLFKKVLHKNILVLTNYKDAKEPLVYFEYT